MPETRPPNIPTDADRFLVEMAEGLSAYGAPAHRVEEAMSACAERLGLPAEFFITPTSVFASIGEGDQNRTRLARFEPGEVNLGLLVRLDRVLQEVAAGERTAADGLSEVDRVRAEPPGYPAPLRIASTGLASASAGAFFSGGIVDIAAAGVLGVVVGILLWLAVRVRRLARLLEFVAGAVGALAAAAVGAVFAGADPRIIIISGLILLIPGLTLTMAVSELATRNLVAGTARIAGAAMILATIGFGVLAGGRVAAAVGLEARPEPGSLRLWLLGVALLIAPTALGVLFNAARRDLPAITVCTVAGFLAARFVGDASGPELGVCAGAFVVGTLSNLRASWRNTPASVTLVPGILLLVPGSIGFRSVAAFAEHRALDGVETAVLAVGVAVALVIGLLLANAVCSPRRAL